MLRLSSFAASLKCFIYDLATNLASYGYLIWITDPIGLRCSFQWLLISHLSYLVASLTLKTWLVSEYSSIWCFFGWKQVLLNVRRSLVDFFNSISYRLTATSQLLWPHEYFFSTFIIRLSKMNNIFVRIKTGSSSVFKKWIRSHPFFD